MASANTLCKQLLGVKSAVVTGHDFYQDSAGVNHLRIHARPDKRHEDDCPFCHMRCRPYDVQTPLPRTWRALDWGGTLVEIKYRTHRILCPEHGVLVADVPWAYPGSGFTKDFDLTVGWLAVYLPRSAVSEYMRIDWETVGRCVHRTLNEIEPERSRRLDHLVNIGIDETSYRKGHKYITVVVNHDTNTVVWAAQGHGKKVLEQFYRQLTPSQLSSIRAVTGDGARWITDCVNEFTPSCERCVDPFHVVEWAMEALDEVRREVWREAHAKAVQAAKTHPRGKGRPKADDLGAKIVAAAKARAEAIRDSAFALGKAPEHLTEKQQIRIAMIAENNNRLYRAYRMKETLRLHRLDVEQRSESHMIFSAVVLVERKSSVKELIDILGILVFQRIPHVQDELGFRKRLLHSLDRKLINRLWGIEQNIVRMEILLLLNDPGVIVPDLTDQNLRNCAVDDLLN